MKRSSAAFLQGLIVLVGACAFAFLLWEPHLEGRNAHATVLEIYFKDTFLAYAYLASSAFFIGLYQAFKLLGYVRQDKTYSPESVKALRTIKHCALALIGFVAVSVVFMRFEDEDDRPPGVFMRLLVLVPSIAVATAAANLGKLLAHDSRPRGSQKT
jgi:hypothetical protein